MTSDVATMLPADLTGQTVLDVGCGDGVVAREAARRGAERVVAVDIDCDRIERAERSSQVKGIEFRLADVEVQLPPGRFDHVVCHNLLHRVRNPIDVLDRLITATGTALVLDVSGIDDERPARLLRRDYGAPESLRDSLQAMPLMLVGRNGTPHRKREQKFYLSPIALSHLLMEQRRHFASCDVSAGGEPGRYQVRAVRRRVEHLMIVSGPTGSGKSTFLNRIEAANPNAVVANGDRLQALGPVVPELHFHYDLLRPWRRPAWIHERDEALHVVEGADRLSVTTLVARPRELRRRLTDELRELADPDSRGGRRLREVLDLYERPERLADRISAWLDFARCRGATMTFVDSTEGYRQLDDGEWREVVTDA